MRNHYAQVAKETESTSPLNIHDVKSPIVVVPIQAWGKVSQRALEFALALSPDIRALHVASEEETNALQEEWNRMVEMPVKERAARRRS